MWVVKKINNNAAVCRDNNDDELVAFGKGIGFPKTPYELTDMRKISMTFYKLNLHYYQLLKEIPENVFEVSAEIVAQAQTQIPRSLNPNIVFSLADHINFAITRMQQYQNMKLPFSYDVQQLYPAETKMGKFAVKLIRQRLDVHLPNSEVTAIAMHFVNSQSLSETATTKDFTEELIDQATQIIEQQFTIQIDRQGFTYNRFAMHVRYYLKRIQADEVLNEDDNATLFEAMKSESPKIYSCAQAIATKIDEQLSTHSSNDEIFYLMIYIKRMLNKSMNTTNEESSK
ncbi:PRD domain-containing protein [Lactiplantibacillus fabifermentans]|uniref:Transcriptional regulator n=1 Tax=Lactiplantibacillus fabifermentans T30PCM01 TaxID=1400520 RepID=W6T476_9LACO|nr:PRD domain-containing protein [Lactiplantibacillus fabifermentans]ETY72634.1 transcriptional regulator [Lactiplantibacillus fabifermentans T30PCM01]